MSEITKQVVGWTKMENKDKDILQYVNKRKLSTITIFKLRPMFRLEVDFPNGYIIKLHFDSQKKASGKALYYMRVINNTI